MYKYIRTHLFPRARATHAPACARAGAPHATRASPPASKWHPIIARARGTRRARALGSALRGLAATKCVVPRTMLRLLLPIAGLSCMVRAIQPGVVPQPQSITYSGGNVTLSSKFSFTASGEKSAILSTAFDRYGKLLLGSGGGLLDGHTASATVSTCEVDVIDPSLSLDLETDESYTLDLDATKCAIVAKVCARARAAIFHLPPVLIRSSLANSRSSAQCMGWKASPSLSSAQG